MIHTTSIHDFVSPLFTVPVLDVRTPAEFAHGHIPGAVNLPLFTDEERVQVGTTYKQVGREAAILLGFDLAGSKWSGFIRQALVFAPDKKVALHCWRGGMRSGAMAWALDMYGFEVFLLTGGYKKYRGWIHRQFEKNRAMRILGGKTGSGKTRVLHQLQQLGQQVVDLEDLAQHQGSAFGSMGRMLQPTQEQFENNLGIKLAALDAGTPVWVEDESIAIGKRFIPAAFWKQMTGSMLLDLQLPREIRIKNLVDEYGSLDKTFLADCTQKIWKRLGHERTRKAVEAINENRMEDFIAELLVYYDKTYTTSVASRPEQLIRTMEPAATDPASIARQILSMDL
ncbi:MAG: tRNA 2-selenouridine(34) synthase MnmH [Chitinophagaceae bacterium]|nr:MAG: tRNA 2-selenouridine(34) synthase MnmH [Chitinophagaceae bacterium]